MQREPGTDRRQFVKAAAGLATAGALAGCSEQLTGSNSSGPTEAIQTLARGYRENDIDLVTQVIHPESPMSGSISTSTVESATITVTDANVARQSADGAYVTATVTSESGSGESNTATYTFELRKYNGEWKVWQIEQGRNVPTTTSTRTTSLTTYPDGDPRRTIQTFARANRQDDAELARSVIHPDSSLRENVRQNVESNDIDVLEMEVASESETDAVVYARLRIIYEDGSSDPRTTWVTFELRTHDGAWKITTLTEGREQPTETETTTTSNRETYFHDGFEEDLSAWQVVDDRWTRTDAVAYRDTYSALMSASSNVTRIATAALPETRQLGRFAYAWQESDASWGGGIRLLNERGEVEIGFATNNPQWVVDDANGLSQVHQGVGYETWVTTSVEFDWQESAALVRFVHPESGESVTQSRPLKRGRNVASIEVRGFTGERGWQNDSCHMVWDEVVAEI